MKGIAPPKTARVGDSIGERVLGPISRTMLALYAGASLDHNPIHIDSDFARSAGQADVFAHGMLGMAQFGRLITDWAGVDSLKTLSTRFTAVVPVGASIRYSGVISAREEHLSTATIAVDLIAVLESGDLALKGRAEVLVKD